MDGFTSIMLALIIIGLPVIMLTVALNRLFKLREKKLDVDAHMAAEKAAQYASRSSELERRVRVLEQIVTDGGVETAAQIEALRDHTRLAAGDKVLTFVFTIVRHKLGIPVRSMRQMRGDPADSAETVQLREQVKELKERLKVLERITVEKENSLSREIEELRDR